MNQLENKKFYSDYSKLFQTQQKLLSKVFKGILIVFLFAGWLAILATSEKSIIASDIIPVRDFLFLQSFQKEHLNTLVIYRFVVLGFVFFYSIAKNYKNIYFQKESINMYSIWFVLYFALSVVSFGLIIGFNTNQILSENTSFAMQYAYLIFLVLPLILINIAYGIYMYIIKLKTEPLAHNKLWTLTLNFVAQIITFILATAFVIEFVKSAANPNFLFYENKIYNFLRELFVTKSSDNLAIIIFGLIGIGILIISMNLHKILFIASKQYTSSFFKDQLIITIAILFAMLIWFIKVLTYQTNQFQHILEDASQNQQYFYLFSILFSFVFGIVYIVLTFVKKAKVQSKLTDMIIFSLFQSLIWGVALIFNFITTNNFVSTLNIFFAAAFSIAILIIYLATTKNLSALAIIFVLLSTITTILVLFAYGFNQMLVAQNNFAFVAINANVEFQRIFEIINLSSFVIFFIAANINLVVALTRIITIDITKNINEVKVYESAKQ